LRQIFLSTETHAMLKPEFILASALPLFDANGDLQDGATKDRLAAYVAALARWVARLEQDEETLATNQPVLVGVSQR
jgi:hypothetical protein